MWLVALGRLRRDRSEQMSVESGATDQMCVLALVRFVDMIVRACGRCCAGVSCQRLLLLAYTPLGAVLGLHR